MILHIFNTFDKNNWKPFVAALLLCGPAWGLEDGLRWLLIPVHSHCVHPPNRHIIAHPQLRQGPHPQAGARHPLKLYTSKKQIFSYKSFDNWMYCSMTMFFLFKNGRQGQFQIKFVRLHVPSNRTGHSLLIIKELIRELPVIHSHVGGRCTLSAASKWASLELLLDLRSLLLFCTSFTLEVGLINDQSAVLKSNRSSFSVLHLLCATYTNVRDPRFVCEVCSKCRTSNGSSDFRSAKGVHWSVKEVHLCVQNLFERCTRSAGLKKHFTLNEERKSKNKHGST